MKYCDKCKVNVRGDAETCPLCQHKLSGTGGPEPYPKIQTIFSQFGRLFKFLILLTVSGAILCAAINLLLPQSGYWSVFVVLGVVCFWISFAFTFKRRANLPRTITTELILISIFCVLWDAGTHWHGWSVDFVIPIAGSTAMLSIATIAKIRRMPASDYIVYFVLDIILGIVPLVFYLTGILRVALPSLLCISISLISLITLLLFEGKNMKTELSKRLHL